jgi:DNA repair exonuclease SbcCD ATPase subunit
MPRAAAHSEAEIRATIEELVAQAPDRDRAVRHLTATTVRDALGPHPETGERTSWPRIGKILDAVRAEARNGEPSDDTDGEMLPETTLSEELLEAVAHSKASLADTLDELMRKAQHEQRQAVETEQQRARDLLDTEARRHASLREQLEDELVARNAELQQMQQAAQEQDEEVEALKQKLAEKTEQLATAERARDAAQASRQEQETRAAELQNARAEADRRAESAERERDAAREHAARLEAAQARTEVDAKAQVEQAATARTALEAERDELRRDLREARQAAETAREETTAARIEAARAEGELETYRRRDVMRNEGAGRAGPGRRAVPTPLPRPRRRHAMVK